MTPIAHPRLHRLAACVLALVLLCWTLAPVAFAISASASKGKPTCKPGTALVRVKQRMRVTVRVRRHGKVKRKRVWVTRSVWTCGVAKGTAPAAADAVAPAAPTGLQAAPGNGQVTLVWNVASDNVGVAGYRVFRDGTLVASPTDALHVDKGLANGHAYTYGVAAVDAAGNMSPVASATATPKAPAAADTTAPTAPPAFTATAGDRQVGLSWSAASDDVGVVYYELRRDGQAIAFQEGRTFTDVQLANGTVYAYTVVAYDAAGNVSPASSATATPSDTTAPSVPAGLAATPGDAQVSLTWTPATDNVGVTSYRVYRDGMLIASPATPYHSDAPLGNGVQHSYTVAAVDAAGNVSAPSAAVLATPAAPVVADTTKPSIPANIVGTPGTNSVSLTWSASTDNVGVTRYHVYRNGTLVGSPVGPSFGDTGLQNGTPYTYTVTALDAAGNESSPSAGVVVTPKDTQPPSIPGGIVLTKNAQNHSITVTWTPSTDNVGVVKYRVYRKTNSGAFVLVAQPATTSYSDIDLANGKTYAYTVEALDAAGNVSAQAPSVSTYVS